MTTVDHTELDRASAETALLTQYAALVRRHAHQLARQAPACIGVDDLLQVGRLGLLEAAQRYDPTQQSSFAAFASLRVRGAMIDELRRMSWRPRSLHRKAQRLARVKSELEHVGQVPQDRELAEALGIGFEGLLALQQDLQVTQVTSIEGMAEWLDDETQEPDELWCGAANDSPLHACERAFVERGLDKAMAHLGPREREVLQLYYRADKRLHEIGALLGVSESRVSQIHRQAIAELRDAIHRDARLADLGVS